MFITYEEPFAGKTFIMSNMKKIYNDMVDKSEYSDFECWMIDMLRSGVFVKV